MRPGLQVAAALGAAATTTLIVFLDWVPTPLNRNILQTPPRTRLPSTVIHAATGAAVVTCHLLGRRRLALAGALWYSVVSASAALNWWVPYALGIHSGEVDPTSFQREYAGNVSVLPRIGDHLVVPDLQHLILHTSIGTSCALSWLWFARATTTPSRRRP